MNNGMNAQQVKKFRKRFDKISDMDAKALKDFSLEHNVSESVVKKFAESHKNGELDKFDAQRAKDRKSLISGTQEEGSQGAPGSADKK